MLKIGTNSQEMQQPWHLLVKHVCVHARTHMHARIRADDELTDYY